jgi:hypothetical protein
MPYARSFVKVNILGHFGASGTPGIEQWQAGFHISSLGGGSFDPTNLLAYLTSIAPAVSTYHANSNVAAGTDCYVDALNAAYIGTDGLYVLGALQPTTVFTLGTPTQGTGTPYGPFSQAMCITFKSLRLRGPASRGRMYWPALGQSMASGTGLVPTSITGLAATAAQTMINAFNAQAAAKFGTGSNVSLVSKVGSGAEAIVTQVGIGQKLDAQESRERNLLEAHTFRTLTVTAAAIAERDRELRDGYELIDDEDASVE